VKLRLVGLQVGSGSPPATGVIVTIVVPTGWDESLTVKSAHPSSGTVRLVVDGMIVGVCEKLACTVVAPVMETVAVGLEALTRLCPLPEVTVHPAKL
jgi:hypothetical protein